MRQGGSHVCPALRLGFLIVPHDLWERLIASRRAAAVSPPGLDQAVLADVMAGGHCEHPLRRSRAVYRERLEALSDATVRYYGGPFACARGAPASPRSGDLVGVAEDLVAQERMRRTASCSASAPSRPA